ncbi:hypothetical protein INT43_007407 [Umbelopsis isabellina]|uniref:Uncharacterized protein n=1 Tax=Mortierella isabellina TaxID=91625 RepID=A0A8H7PY98_MORIS|nr:hypothetical protein INT43_007407 [Umbelopsis isabellina]
MTDSNIANAVKYLDETYEPSNIKKQRDRTDLLHLVRSYVNDLLEQELYGKYMLPDDRCGFWPQKEVASKLGGGHKGFADVWPIDRSAHLVGVEHQHVTHSNALTDIPAEKKVADFETGLDMMISEIFGSYESEQRQSGTRDSSIFELDSDVYQQLKHNGEKETNDILDYVAKLIDQMLACKQAATQNNINWKSIGMTPPNFTAKALKHVTRPHVGVDSIDWRVVMHCAKHIGVPESVLESSQKRLEDWYAARGDRPYDISKALGDKRRTFGDKPRTSEKKPPHLPPRRYAASKEVFLATTRTPNTRSRSALQPENTMDANEETSTSKRPRLAAESASE